MNSIPSLGVQLAASWLVIGSTLRFPLRFALLILAALQNGASTNTIQMRSRSGVGGKNMQIRSLGKNIDLVVLGERQDVDQRASFFVGKCNTWCVFWRENWATSFFWREPSKVKKNSPPN
jgi:hypothetical protein